MYLTNKEQEKLMIFTASNLALQRKAKGLKLNYPETVAIISSFILEGAREGKSVAQLMVEATKVLSEDDVLEGVANMIDMIQTEATFDDGTKLVTVHNPIRAKKTDIVAGEYFIDEGDIIINEALEEISIEVCNSGDRAVQIGSHFHFFEVNASLEFDREKAYGKRLNILAGTCVRFEPGSQKEVSLVDFTGKRFIKGFNNLVDGYLDNENTKKEAFKKLELFIKDAK